MARYAFTSTPRTCLTRCTASPAVRAGEDVKPAHVAPARGLVDQEGRPVKEVAALLGVHRSTLYRALDQVQWRGNPKPVH